MSSERLCMSSRQLNMSSERHNKTREQVTKSNKHVPPRVPYILARRHHICTSDFRPEGKYGVPDHLLPSVVKHVILFDKHVESNFETTAS